MEKEIIEEMVECLKVISKAFKITNERISKLESQVKELKKKHILMEKAIERKAGMLEPIRKEDWRFRK
jgi:hypothetical protein